MKIGIHQHVFVSRLDGKNINYLNLIRDIGYESVDINVRVIDIDDAKVIKKRADKLGLTLVGGGSLPQGKELLSPLEDKRRDAINYMKSLIRIVAELGSTLYSGVIYSPCGLIVGRGPTDEEFLYAATGLSEVARYAKAYGIYLAIEPVNRYETYLINTIYDAIKLIKMINEDNVGILYDTFHMNIEEKSFYDSIKEAGKLILHVHVNENDRGTPGTGHINWAEIFRALKDIDYDNVVAIESFVDSSIDIASGVCVWRKLAPSSESLAKEGYNFIKSMLGY